VSERCTARHEVADVERLGQVLERAALGGPHRREQRVLRAHTMTGRSGRSERMRGQEVEGVLVRQAHVGNDDVALPGRDPLPQRRRHARRLHLVP
jgi:hypothetical protein